MLFVLLVARASCAATIPLLGDVILRHRGGRAFLSYARRPCAACLEINVETLCYSYAYAYALFGFIFI